MRLFKLLESYETATMSNAPLSRVRHRLRSLLDCCTDYDGLSILFNSAIRHCGWHLIRRLCESNQYTFDHCGFHDGSVLPEREDFNVQIAYGARLSFDRIA